MSPSIFAGLPNDLIMKVIKINTDREVAQSKSRLNECMKHIIKCRECGWAKTYEEENTPWGQRDTWKHTSEHTFKNNKFIAVWDSNTHE
jgi:hypothetical protein